VPSDIYNRAHERASRDRTSVQELLRRGLRQVLDDDRADADVDD
jgi:hypothetical protein